MCGYEKPRVAFSIMIWLIRHIFPDNDGESISFLHISWSWCFERIDPSPGGSVSFSKEKRSFIY